ncbi:hypothetical protein niasHT_030015 [Heterodera trifolii]|uniref:Uncharacterized protein n=1 Tax=Heterodera trifolii TaxID=157864 RepID=A0ABD2JRQ3_9BILA
MNTLHGSRKSMCEKLMAKGERISIRIYPFACWLICFEDFLPTEQNFRRFEVLVFQSPVVRIMLEILNITVFMELSSRKHLYFQISNFAAMIFMFIGSYGSYVIVPVGASLLHEYRHFFAALPYRRLLPIVLVRSKVCRRLLRHYRHGAYNIARFHQIALFGGGTM